MAAPPFRSAAELGRSQVTTTQRYTRMVDGRRKATVLALDYGTKAASSSEPLAKVDAATATGSS